MPSNKILVYVQAIPTSISDKARNFKDLSSSSVRMAHSSKVALDQALKISKEVVALGHSSILSEALAHGANEAKALPFCDDPVAQAESMQDSVVESNEISILVGENLDGPFSGASLCGALSSIYDLRFSFSSNGEDASPGSVVLVKDTGTETFNIDIRAIDYATSQKFPESTIVGSSALEKTQRPKTAQLPIELSAKEIATTLSRKLRRLSS
jgi:hypothetical protein